MFAKMKQMKQSLKNPLNKLKQSIKQMSNAMTQQKIVCTQIIPNKLYHVPYPTLTNLSSLEQHQKQSNQYQIWNISEYPYTEDILLKLIGSGGRNSDGKQIVYNLTFQYFANIPFCQMIKAIQSIQTFLSLNSNNRVYVHCQQNKRRTAVFLASYVYLTGRVTDIVQAILDINQKLSISMEDRDISQNSKSLASIYKSQHVVLKNLMNYINNNAFINKKTWVLRKILINNAPKIHMVLRNCSIQHKQLSQTKPIKYRVLLQMRSTNGLQCKQVFNDEFTQGESLCLRLPKDSFIHLKDDFLIIVKYVYEKKGYSIIRTQLNTNFIYDPYLRINRQDMDLSLKGIDQKNQHIFMDLLLEQNQQLSQLAQINLLKDTQEKTSKNKQEKVQIKIQKNKDNQEDEEDFKILNQQEQAQHNQKIQKQIQLELKKQLQNLRKKKFKPASLQEPKLVKQEPKLVKQEPKFVKEETKLVKEEPKLVKQGPILIKQGPTFVKIENAIASQNIKQKNGFIELEQLKIQQQQNDKEVLQSSDQNFQPLQQSSSQQQKPLSPPQQINERIQGPQQIKSSSEKKQQKEIVSQQLPRKQQVKKDEAQSSQQEEQDDDSSQEQDEDDDLDDYLQKLEKQAQKS